MKTYPFLDSFAQAAYPCYWRSSDGDEFWMNGAAEEVDNPLYDGAVVRRLLASHAEADPGLNAPRPARLGNATQLWGLSVLPLEGGLFAAKTGSSEVPAASIGAQLRDPVANIFFSLPPLVSNSDEIIEEGIEGIQRNCYTLLRQITNLENAAVAVRTPKSYETIDLNRFLRALVDGVVNVLKSHILIEMDLPDTPLYIRGSERLLSEAVLNILRNSLQYTRDGNIIRLRLRSVGNRALLTIEDGGLGIKPENLAHVFEPYFSADPYADGAPQPGLGLGLAVAQEIARSHGGTITCESTFGEGTRLSLALPLGGEGDNMLHSEAAGYQNNRYSPIFVQLEGHCLMPELESPCLRR